MSRAATIMIGFAALVATAPAPARADERSEIAAARAAALQRYVERERGCRDRFVVTSCVDEARRERRATLDALRERQMRLDESKREERATTRRREIAEKADEDARRERERAAKSADRATGKDGEPSAAASADASAGKASDAASGGAGKARKPRKPGPEAKPSNAVKPPVKPKSESAAERAAREEKSRAAYAKRRRDAAAHREDAIDKTIRRMGDKSPAASLPVPGAPSSPAAAAKR